MSSRYALTAIFAKKIQKPGKYADSIHGLYLQVTKALTKSWLFRYTIHEKRREMGIGAYPSTSLAEAREKAALLYKQVKDNPLFDPIAEREKELRQHKIKHHKEKVTFRWCAEQYIDAHKAGWANAKHCQQWTNTLTTYTFPIIGNHSVKDIDTDLIMKVLKPIWESKNETAGRLRGRIEKILSWAAVQKYRDTDNPAQWRGHLENLLVKSSKIKNIVHHKALPYVDINEFIIKLRMRNVISAYALEFLILTAARTEEVIGALWQEIDFEDKVWSIPGLRMKGKKRAHSVPLSPRAFAIIKKMHEMRTSNYIFPGGIKDRGLSNGAMDKLLQKTMGYDCTVHGFRSTFRDWTANETDYPNELCEMALAHTIKNQAEAAYRRGDMLDKRLVMMTEWLSYCETPRITHK